MKGNKKRSKKSLKWIIIGAVAVAVAAVLLIVNVFVPLKYLSAYVVFAKKPEIGELRVRFVDVGYGNCAVLDLPDGKTAVIDGGDGSYHSQLKLLKALNSSGADRIDYLICTSPKKEHCGGFDEILKLKEVGDIFAPYCPEELQSEKFSDFIFHAERKGHEIETCAFGTGIVSDGGEYFFTVLSPFLYNASGDIPIADTAIAAGVDALSSAIWLEYAGRGVLFMSDAPESVQSQIFDAAAIGGGILDIDGNLIDLKSCCVVQTPAHGALSAYREELYDLISPDAAIISVGDNAQGCPDELMLAGLKARCDVYRTDADGAITVTISGDGDVALSKEKQ